MTGELGGQVRMAASVPPRSDLEAITKRVTTDLPGECHIVVMSNGAFGGLHQQLVKHLST